MCSKSFRRQLSTSQKQVFILCFKESTILILTIIYTNHYDTIKTLLQYHIFLNKSI